MDTKLLLKILNFIISGLLVALIIFRFINAKEMKFSQILITVYFLIFTIIIICSELKITLVLDLFSFQKYYIGRGIFLIFIAFLCLDYIDNLKSTLGALDIIMGILMILVGIFHLYYGIRHENNAIGDSSDDKNLSNINQQGLGGSSNNVPVVAEEKK